MRESFVTTRNQLHEIFIYPRSVIILKLDTIERSTLMPNFTDHCIEQVSLHPHIIQIVQFLPF
jgi:hypothetical protein